MREEHLLTILAALPFVAALAIATLLIASIFALFRHDLKGLLAYSMISHLGLITALAGIGSTGAIFTS